ncbi:TPA: hypothetical protein I4D94_11320 [Enterobacter asburiae]|nr:hypothetical protein [Enterobacter asburiae]
MKLSYEELEARCAALVAENAGLINSSVFTLQDGRPPYGFYASEWFIAKLKNGEYAALKALPEEYSYDYRTNDGTYYTKDWVVGWMQTPDTEYRPNVKTPATDAFLAEVRASGVELFAAHKRERQQALRSRSMRMSEEAAGMAADAEDFADQIRKGVQS